MGKKEKQELSGEDRELLLTLGENIEYIWNHEKSDIEIKKKIIYSTV